MQPLIHLPRTASADDVASAIRLHGCVVIDGLGSSYVDSMNEELAPFLARAPRSQGDFMGTHTQRINRLIARSGACRELVMLPLVLETVTKLFEQSCYHPQIAWTQAIRIHPGESAQSLHRDDNVFFFRHPRPPAVLNTMWALDEFTVENGATRLIPGSHLWDDEREVDEALAVSAVMERGSMLMWDGAVHHGGGANASSRYRTGVVLAYNLGWLRQYENMYLSVPPALAREFSPELQQWLGYRNHGYLGTYEGNDPREWLADPSLELPAASDLFTPDLEGVQRIRA